jgi:zinc D-Ala-D-Ala carboxypeptidase
VDAAVRLQFKLGETTLKYFTPEELRCSCCDQDGMNEAFMEKVSELREQLGFPFIVTSAYRCVKHPIEARKNSPGAHTTGRAIDIGVSGLDAYVVLRAALNAGFTGIGVKQKGKGRFIHLDDIEDSGDRPRPWVWSY